MDRYPSYLWMVVAYMAALIIGATVAAMWACDMNATDSFYFVVQTLWTVGYGDVTPSGEEGRIIAIAVMLFGTVGITSALGVVGGMILDRHAKRHDALEREVEDRRRRNLESLYRWAESRGLSKESVDRALEETRDER